MCRRYSLDQVKKATGGWAEANHIGTGGYGEVYKGVCPFDDSVVWAVKRAKILTNDFKREVFGVVWWGVVRCGVGYEVVDCGGVPRYSRMTSSERWGGVGWGGLGWGVVWCGVGYEVVDCGGLGWDLCIESADVAWQVEEMATKSHPHLVRLLGYCVDMDMTTEHHEQIVIYEFCANGDLEKYLHGGAREGELTLQQRMDVLVGVARGLEYLHQFDIVHRDVKPANVLLDARMQPKVSDFGLVRMTEGTTVNPTRVVGTPGYVDPAYSRTNKATPMADVHSYGVLLLEVITLSLSDCVVAPNRIVLFPHAINFPPQLRCAAIGGDNAEASHPIDQRRAVQHQGLGTYVHACESALLFQHQGLGTCVRQHSRTFFLTHSASPHHRSSLLIDPSSHLPLSQVRPFMEESKVAAFKDPLLPEASDDLILTLAKIGLQCTALPPSSRPSMSEISRQLDTLRKDYFRRSSMDGDGPDSADVDQRLAKIDQELDRRAESGLSIQAEFVRLNIMSESGEYIKETEISAATGGYSNRSSGVMLLQSQEISQEFCQEIPSGR
ncbi:unnamed protein product [Closterium sp. NIES-53]